MADYMKKPCEHCPYRSDVKPYLTPERGEELAYHVQNPYNSFPCHKTTEASDDDDGEMHVTCNSKECAGFLTVMANELGEGVLPEGFEPSYKLCYTDSWEMSDAYKENDEEEDEEETKVP